MWSGSGSKPSTVGEEQAGLVAERQADPTVGRPDRPGADPHHVAGGAQRVEVGGLVLGQAHAEDVAVERRRHQRRALELRHHVDEGVDAAAGLADAVPAGQEAGERAGVDRLDLLAQRGERPAPELPEHVAVAPLPLDAVGPELAAHHPAVALEGLQRGPRPGRRPGRSDRRRAGARNGPWVRA